MREMRGEVGKKIPIKEMENMTSQEDDGVQKLCILGFVILVKQGRKCAPVKKGAKNFNILKS